MKDEWCKSFDFSKIPEELNEKFSIDDLILDYRMLWELYNMEVINNVSDRD